MRSPWRDLFDADPGYLNTASLGVPPRAAADEIDAALADWRRGRLQPPDFDDYVTRARRAWAGISGVDPAWVATGATVSGLVGLVAAAVPDGAEILVAEGDFTSVLFPFAAQSGRGVRLVAAPLADLAQRVHDGTHLIALSSAQSADGAIADVAALQDAAAAHDARILLDTTQSCGWLPLDCSRIDYAVCAGYKWLLAPRGVAFMSVRPERLAGLTPHAAGWYAGDDIWTSIYGLPMRLAADARRLDTSPAWFSWVGAAHSLELLAGLDPAAVHAHDVALADALLERLGMAARGSAIVTVASEDGLERLAAAGVRAASRAGRTRLSFHLYNDMTDVALAAAALTGGPAVDARSR